MKSNQLNVEELVETIRLPYIVPVDLMVRCFTLIFLLGMLFQSFTCIQNPNGILWYEWVLLTAGLVFSLYVFARPSGLSIHENGIEHKRFWVLKRKFGWNEIEKVATGTQESLGVVDNTMGPYLMIFFLKNGKKPFLLNIKPYTRKGLAILVFLLTRKASHADIDKATHNLTKGIVPSAFFQT